MALNATVAAALPNPRRALLPVTRPNGQAHRTSDLAIPLLDLVGGRSNPAYVSRHSRLCSKKKNFCGHVARSDRGWPCIKKNNNKKILCGCSAQFGFGLAGFGS